MWDAVFGGEEGAIEDFACVPSGEVPRFGDGVKDLEGRCAVDGEVIDGFVGDGVVRDERGFGKHGGDGSGVGLCKGLALEIPDVSVGYSGYELL